MTFWTLQILHQVTPFPVLIHLNLTIHILRGKTSQKLTKSGTFTVFRYLAHLTSFHILFKYKTAAKSVAQGELKAAGLLLCLSSGLCRYPVRIPVLLLGRESVLAQCLLG
jgi:hypothetical protein